jgi:hypothetical protein
MLHRNPVSGVCEGAIAPYPPPKKPGFYDNFGGVTEMLHRNPVSGVCEGAIAHTRNPETKFLLCVLCVFVLQKIPENGFPPSRE